MTISIDFEMSKAIEGAWSPEEKIIGRFCTAFEQIDRNL
jgi:hypothetical protein